MLNRLKTIVETFNEFLIRRLRLKNERDECGHGLVIVKRFNCYLCSDQRYDQQKERCSVRHTEVHEVPEANVT